MPGIHDSSAFSDEVKKHWIFGAYVKPLDEVVLLKEQEASNLAAHVEELGMKNTNLKVQLESWNYSVGNLTTDILALKAHLAEKGRRIVPLKR